MKHQNIVLAHPASQDRAGHEPSQSSLSRPVGDHPIAQGRKDFTIADVLAWARTKPADERYNYLSTGNCALCQFLRDTGRMSNPRVGSLGYREDGWGMDRRLPLPDSLDNAVVAGMNWTFGALVARLEALCPETPLTKSDWLAIDAYMVAEQVSA